MMQVLSRVRGALWLGGTLLVLLLVPVTGCGDGDSLASSGNPPGDSIPPIDSTPTDTTTPPPPVDTTTPPPPDTTGGPGPTDCPPVTPSTTAPVHVGLPFGPNHSPRMGDPPFTLNQITALTPSCLLEDLEAARRANVQVFISFTGNEQYLRDANGFSLTKWKQRVDRFRGIDITPYIADGTILAHFIMDEPNDLTNWSGHVVSREDIEEIARYSKSIWPTITTMIRAWPDYLDGFQWKSLDAVWFHYIEQRGPIEPFLEKHLANARALGLNIVGGLNVLNGGSKNSGIPGKSATKNGMNADELRTWGGKFLDQPGLCAFLLWEYKSDYFARPEIRAALNDLAAKARAYPKQSCKRT